MTERVCHHLTAADLVTDTVDREKAVADAIEAERKRKPKMRGKSAFKKTDVTRAAQAMREAGVQGRIELPGGITMLVDSDGQHEPEPNPWEES